MPAAQPGQPRAMRLRNNILWIFLGRGVYAASQWGMLIALAKLGSAEMIGRYTLALAIAAPVILFFEMKLREVQAADANDRHQFGDYFALRSFTVALALLLIVGIALSSGFSRQAVAVLLAVGVCKAVESSSDIHFGLMQKHEKMHYIAASLMLKGVLSLGALSLVLYLFRDLFWAVAAMLGVYLGVLAFDVRNARFASTSSRSGTSSRNLQPRYRWQELRSLGQLALPLGLGAALVSLTFNIPRYLLERYHGEAALGYFAAVSYLPFAGLLAIDAMGQSALPRFARYYREDLPAYRRLLSKLLGLGTALGLCGVLFAVLLGPRFLVLAYRPEYARYSGVFTWMMLAGCMLYLCSIVGIGLTAARALKVQMRIAMAVFASSVLAALWLVPAYAERGAAWSFLIGCTVWFGLDAAAAFQAMAGSPTAHSETLSVPSKIG